MIPSVAERDVLNSKSEHPRDIGERAKVVRTNRALGDAYVATITFAIQLGGTERYEFGETRLVDFPAAERREIERGSNVNGA
jgi:hypothetical protein